MCVDWTASWSFNKTIVIFSSPNWPLRQLSLLVTMSVFVYICDLAKEFGFAKGFFLSKKIIRCLLFKTSYNLSKKLTT